MGRGLCVGRGVPVRGSGALAASADGGRLGGTPRPTVGGSQLVATESAVAVNCDPPAWRMAGGDGTPPPPVVAQERGQRVLLIDLEVHFTASLSFISHRLGEIRIMSTRTMYASKTSTMATHLHPTCETSSHNWP